MAFDPKEHLRKIGQKDYLDTSWRVVWFKEVHPHGRIETEPFTVGNIVYMKAFVFDAENKLLATGSATVRDARQHESTWAGRIIEKAETAAIGRALAHAGFGTQFTGEDDDDNLADSPKDASAGKSQQSQQKQANRQQSASQKSGQGKEDKKSTNPDDDHFGKKGFDMNLLKELTKPLYDNAKHQTNSINKLFTDGVLLADMNVDTAAAYVFRHRAGGKELGFDDNDIKNALSMTLGEFLKRNPRRYGLAWEHLLNHNAKLEKESEFPE